MIAVIFEVTPHPDRKADYLDMAALMRPLVDEIDGFISVERFQSLTNPDKLLSLSFFRDEEAIADWRRLTKHRAAQSAGRAGMFTDYQLRIAHVIRDYGLFDRDEAPRDSREKHG
ncbi:antibiotic biosynthesis monooxygenase [uncultured Sulfitobacter sp.]|uniref:antibiotic biosynthesis monooxygenase family protein n=1 Tax=uncultured Sulfitobacter sp. TaxID=191468 RepID=UPI00261E58F4|nr:antibiotic biosynthesis monooxygenase [uncultured Sulfitobacter sp.]